MNWTLPVYLVLLIVSIVIYPLVSTGGVVILFGNLAKIISLVFACVNLTATRNAFAPGDTPRRAWTWLAAGMWIWLLAQLIFAFYKLILKQSPYPSPADLFFVIAYFPLFIGLMVLVKDFKSTGLPMGSAGSYVVQGFLLLGAYGTVFFTLLLKFLRNEDALELKFLNVGYPTFDFLLIAMTSVLIRVSWMLRGGSLAKSWIMLCVGFLVLGVADIAFAYNAYPFLDILFFSSYFFVALAGVYQLRMLSH